MATKLKRYVMSFNDNRARLQTDLQKTQNTLWPSHTTHQTKVWVDKFFQLLDGYSSEAGQQWAELYTPDGEFEAFGQTFRGLEAIKAHILRFWAMFPGLLHTPKSVYISQGTHIGSQMDIIAITCYAVAFPNGHHVTGESVAVMNVVQQGDQLAIRSNKLYLDPNPLMQALGAQSTEEVQKEITTTHHENITEELSSNIERFR